MWYQVIILILAIGGARILDEIKFLEFYQGYFYLYIILFVVCNIIVTKIIYDINKEAIIKDIMEKYSVNEESLEIEEEDKYSYIIDLMAEILKIIIVSLAIAIFLKMDIYLIFYIISISNVALSIRFGIEENSP